jgi:hypothetical protein
MKALAAALALAVFPTWPAAVEPATNPPRPAAPAGGADATRQAKAHFQKGTQLYRQARYREAIAEFEAAYRLRPHGVIFYNLAQCHERLGDLPAALRAYHEYLRAVPDAEDRATVTTAMENLGRRLGATGVQQLLVYSQPTGAEVSIDGQPRGNTPFAAVLPHGKHAVSVAKRGYATLTRDAELTASRSVVLEVALTPSAEGAPGAAAGPGAAAAGGAVPPELAPGPPAHPPLVTAGTPEVTASAARPRVWTWVAAGVAGAALAAGIAYGIAAKNASDDLRSSQHDQATAQRLADSASSRSRTANVLYGVAGVAGAAGVTLFFVEGSF